MPQTDRTERARAFARLHRATHPLVLPNAWDVSSALAVRRAGAAAVATTSAGHAWSLGRNDGGDLDVDGVVTLLARIVAAVDVPVTADIESGYADGQDALARNMAAILDTGVVGINIEDSDAGSLRAAADQAARIETVRRAAAAAGVPLFVNARIDTYFVDGFPDDERADQTLARATAYVDAGADGVFVPGLVDLPALSELTGALDVPVNVMLQPGAPSVADLAAAGVRRISVGPALHAVAVAAVEAAATELLGNGMYPV
ncbi:isocitrate lyase/PEP mutase family protein [Solicola gregarius]|uniref:Isocitrate lyase/phosphoenolpyruvate mutase family protein n=1 Tax=Solicola gregarius TaxID=2908642 RepID=A0AA46TL61_9ACTN|nr:isocitrate lyase/phosphoenolpyruvate mutase family protein [Solicola gregarius]UYM07327.1 isocitrate lyase/phosphoenolpyruvate mutase family protein [Solicola gregarius]